MLALERRICPLRLRTLRRSRRSWSKRIGRKPMDAGVEGPFSMGLMALVRQLAIRSTTLPLEPRPPAFRWRRNTKKAQRPSQVRTKASRRTGWRGIASSLTRRGIAFSLRRKIKMSSTTKDLGIIVGVDGSPASDAAVSWAAHDAVMRGVPLTLMHVQDPIGRTWSQAKELEEVSGWQKAERRGIPANASQIG